MKSDTKPLESTQEKRQSFTAIVTRTSYLFGLMTTTKIYFDAPEHFSHAKEAPATSEWSMQKNEGFGNGTYMFVANKPNGKGGAIGIFFEREGKEEITGYCYYRPENERHVRKKQFSIVSVTNTKFQVKFKYGLVHIDDAMFIADFIIRRV